MVDLVKIKRAQVADVHEPRRRVTHLAALRVGGRKDETTEAIVCAPLKSMQTDLAVLPMGPLVMIRPDFVCR